MEGELSHRVEDQMYFSFDVCGKRALCLSYPEGDEDDFTYIFFASLIDIPSGAKIARTLQGSCRADKWLILLYAVAGDFFLVMYSGTQDAHEQDGIHVLNQTDLVQVSHFRGRFSRIKTSGDDGSSIVAIGRGPVVNVFSMNHNGTLVRSHTLTLAWISPPYALFLSRSLLYISNGETRDESSIRAYDIRSGEQVKALYYPRHKAFDEPRDFASNGRELFCGFSRNGSSYRYLPSIQAFPL